MELWLPESERAWHNEVAIDWDGVIEVFPHIDPPTQIDGAITGLYNLMLNGWFVSIFSGGSQDSRRLQKMQSHLNRWSTQWLKEHGYEAPHMAAWAKDRLNWPISKPRAKVYVDDRGLKFEGWDKINHTVLNNYRAWWQHKASTH